MPAPAWEVIACLVAVIIVIVTGKLEFGGAENFRE